MYLTLEPTKKTTDAATRRIEGDFAGKVLFMKLDWASAKGKEAAKAYGIETPPAAVVVDKHGHVVAKTEGVVSAVQMKKMLDGVVKVR